MDHATAVEGFKMPGIDPRQWVSYGIVEPGSPQDPSVRFKDDNGNPSPYGPMVDVTLQPSGITLPCRVAGAVAGEFEADWYPFVGGDEVIVLIPEGDERAGAVIIGRLNQELDQWPIAVAGQDATKNTFGFRRMRTPFIVETAASYLIRSALTGAQIGIDSEGKVIVNDGDKGSMTIGPDSIGFTSGDQESFVTVLPGDTQVYLGAGSTTFLLDASESKFISQGSISFATGGGTAAGTAVTAEQVVGLLINVLTALGNTSSFAGGPLAVANFVTSPQAIAAIAGFLQPILAGMALPVPYLGTSGTFAGNFAPFIGTIFGPGGGLQLAGSNPLASVDPTGTTTGYGRPTFKL
jgi:hypothetical protein